MSFIQRIKSVLGLDGSPRGEQEGPVAVTVEHDPDHAETPEVSEASEPVERESPEPQAEDEFAHAGAVTEISGIGPSYSERLEENDIHTIGDLANADPDIVAEQTDLSEKRVTGWIESARDLASGE